MLAILIFMAALLFFVVALEVDLRRHPRRENMDVEDDGLLEELTQSRLRREKRCACDPLDERRLGNIDGI